jgi:hypothetical protein
MPILAGEAHPSGPEDRPFADRTLQVRGVAHDIFLSLSFPKPDDGVDRASNGFFSAASDPSPVPLMINFDYRGYFWQGVFGAVGFDVRIKRREPDAMPWKDLESLQQGIRIQSIALNQARKNDNSESRQQWAEPFLSQLNGVPCVLQFVSAGNDPKHEWRYYFQFEDDYALEIRVTMVDNSTRPGLVQSDWRPRAEAFANKLLSTVKVRIAQLK